MYYSQYKQKLITPEKAASMIDNSAVIVHGMVSAEPPGLLGAIAERVKSGDLREIKVFSLFPQEVAGRTVLAPEIADRVHAYSWFLSKADRSLVRKGLDHFVPCNFHEVPQLCRDFMEIDVSVTTVSPMDKAGFFTFGTVNDFISVAARNCKTLMVEVNRHMPRVFGSSLLHISEVDCIVENDVPLMETPVSDPKPEDEIVGRRIAEMVPDGATIQLGIGAIPNSAAACLEGHRDLGIHSELFCPGMVELIRKGVVTGQKKNLHPMKHVFTNILGTRDTYDFVDDNPSMESYPVSYVNDPTVIAQNDNMISVNATIEVDLNGQCNSEHLDGAQFSGSGGQLDFVRGAFHSKGGKSIIAFRSTAKNGEVSRVVPRFKTGVMITVPRMDTHYLVTEYGTACLKGKSERERALAIINIAHPKFRDDLISEAHSIGVL